MIVRRLDQNGFFREQHKVALDKVEGLLERRMDLVWYQLDINVGVDRITEAFEFPAPRPIMKTVRWRIDNHW